MKTFMETNLTVKIKGLNIFKNETNHKAVKEWFENQFFKNALFQ